MMIGKIFENNVDKIEKENDAEILTYNCYNQDNELVLTYQLDWDLNRFSCQYNISSSEKSIVYKSSNLFDNPDTSGGFLEYKIDESNE